MFLKKLSKAERYELREQRKENQLIRARAKQRRFTYIVNPPPIPRVAFGSSLERETLPLYGPCLTSFMRQQQGDLFLSPGPTARVDERDHLKIAYPSKLGHTAFVSKVLRLPPVQTSNYPCVGTYNVDVKKSQNVAYKPFNIGAARKEQKPQMLTPAPATYATHVPRPQLKITTAFGSQRKFTPAVFVICSPFNISKCRICEQTPIGDYWRNFANKLDMCRPCVNKLERQLKSCSTTNTRRLRMHRELQQYQAVRYCDFYHDHNGTTAASQIITNKTLKFKIKKENYLSLYIVK